MRSPDTPTKVWWRRRGSPALLVPLVIFLAQAVWLFDFSIDDASISYRYAEHLADGDGLRWNPDGPAVEGYSNFLWVLILAGGSRLGFDTDNFASALGVLLGLANLLLFYVLCHRLWSGRPYWWFPVLLVAATPVWVMWLTSGLEIALFGLFLLLILLGLTGSSRQKIVFLSVGLAGLSLTRPEGVALAAVGLVCVWIADRKLTPVRKAVLYGIPAVVLGVVTIGLVVFRLAYFGYPLANTVYAKFSLSLPSAGEVGKWLVFGLPFFAAWLWAGYYRAAVPHRAALAAAIALVAAQMILVLPVVPAMYFMHRYQIAFLPLLILTVPFLLAEVSRRRRVFAVILAAGLLVWTMQGWPKVIKRYEAEKYAMKRQRCVAENLLSLPAPVTVALIDAGRIPYWSDLPSFDIWGLCDAEIAHHGFSYESTLGRNPDVYVMSLNIIDGQVYPRLGMDIMVSGNPTFKEKYRLWKICVGTPPTIEWYYDYGIFINTDWADRHNLVIQKREVQLLRPEKKQITP